MSLRMNGPIMALVIVFNFCIIQTPFPGSAYRLHLLTIYQHDCECIAYQFGLPFYCLVSDGHRLVIKIATVFHHFTSYYNLCILAVANKAYQIGQLFHATKLTFTQRQT